MSIRKDYIERLIEQFVAALARIIKARREQRFADAQQLIRDTALSSLGMEYGALLLADAASTARLLGEPSRVKVLARLVAEDGEVLLAQGDADTASARFRYALALFAEAQAHGLQPDPDDTATLARLRAHLGGDARA